MKKLIALDTLNSVSRRLNTETGVLLAFTNPMQHMKLEYLSELVDVLQECIKDLKSEDTQSTLVATDSKEED